MQPRIHGSDRAFYRIATQRRKTMRYPLHLRLHLGAWVLIGFSSLVIGSILWSNYVAVVEPGPITCNISAEGSLVCVFPSVYGTGGPASQVRVFSLGDGTLLDSVDFPDLGVHDAILAGDRWYLQAGHSTPRGRPTVQIFTMPRGAPGNPSLLVADDETRRAGLSLVAGLPTYMRNNEWRGGGPVGIPWGGTLELCTFDGQQERLIQRINLSYYHIVWQPSMHPRFYPYSLDVPEGLWAALVWVNVEDGTSRRFLLEKRPADDPTVLRGGTLHVASAAMSPTSTEFAVAGSFLDSRPNIHRTHRLIVVDFESGETLHYVDVLFADNHLDSVEAMYCPKGDLYLVVTHPHKRQMTLSRFAEGNVTPVFTIRGTE